MAKPDSERYMSEPPPEVRKVKYNWKLKAEKARERPGEWYLAYERVPKWAAENVTRAGRKGGSNAFVATDGKFEVTLRHQGGKRYDMYIKFTPYTDAELLEIQLEKERQGNEQEESGSPPESDG